MGINNKLKSKNSNSKMAFPKKTPTSEGAKASKTVKKAPKSAGGRKKRRVETFAIYIFKVLKQVHPDVGISKKAMNKMNSFIQRGLNRRQTLIARRIGQTRHLRGNQSR